MRNTAFFGGANSTLVHRTPGATLSRLTRKKSNMSDYVKHAVHGEVAVITMNKPSVNVDLTRFHRHMCASGDCYSS